MLYSADRTGSHLLSPMRIAHHPLFTAREKIEMLEELRDSIEGADLPPDEGFEPGEIEQAMAEIRRDAAGDMRGGS